MDFIGAFLPTLIDGPPIYYSCFGSFFELYAHSKKIADKNRENPR